MKNLIIPQPFFNMLREMTDEDFNLLIKTLIEHTEQGVEPDSSSPIYMAFHVWKMLLSE